MSFLGRFNLSSAPKSTEKQVAELKDAWAKANEKSAKQLERYKELVKFTNVLSEAYINNIQVTIDVSNLLNAYTDLLGEISKGINQLQESMDSGMRSEDIERLKNLTLANIDNINNTFRSGYDKITKVVSAASATPEQLRTLQSAKLSIDQISTSALRSTLAGGKRRVKPAAPKSRKSQKPKPKPKKK